MSAPEASGARPALLRSKLFWVAVLYFSEGFPLGVFYDVFPVWFRQQGVELRSIGLISLLGLAWTLKFLWAPAIDHYRRHRLWMAAADILMGAVMLAFAAAVGAPLWVWLGIGVFTLLSATNDIAIDGYTIELLERNEMGLANGVRIGFYRVGMLAAGAVLILSDYLAWGGAFVFAAVIFGACAALSLAAPREQTLARRAGMSLANEMRGIALEPHALAAVLLLALGCVWLVNSATRWSAYHPNFWPIAWGIALAVFGVLIFARLIAPPRTAPAAQDARQGPMFGALMELLKRPGKIGRAHV